MVDSPPVITLSIVVVALFIVAVLVLSPACTKCQNIKFTRKFPRADLGDGEGMSLFEEPRREVQDGETQRADRSPRRSASQQSLTVSQMQVNAEDVGLPHGEPTRSESRNELLDHSGPPDSGSHISLPGLNRPAEPATAIRHASGTSFDVLPAVTDGHDSSSMTGNTSRSAGAVIPILALSSEAAQISSILQQMDGMWEAIARLRQAHLERAPVSIPVDERSDIGTSLPDYVTVMDDLESGRSSLRSQARA